MQTRSIQRNLEGLLSLLLRLTTWPEEQNTHEYNMPLTESLSEENACRKG